MKSKYAEIFILITGLFFLCIAPARTVADEAKYLWIEMENAERLRDGSLNLRLSLYYGRFPDSKTSASEIQELKAFYIKKSFTKAPSEECFKAGIDTSGNSCFINIKSPGENRYTLYVSGVNEIGSEKHNLFAKTTFALFGKSSNDNAYTLPADTEEINRQFEISTDPEFHYWPQTGSLLKVSVSFNGSPLAFSSVQIHDEYNPEKNIISDSNGEIYYVPPDDNELNRKGSTAFKHTILTVEHSDAGEKYISSRTLIFHRSRYGNHRLSTGLIIFGITIAGFFMFMYFIRKRTVF